MLCAGCVRKKNVMNTMLKVSPASLVKPCGIHFSALVVDSELASRRHFLATTRTSSMLAVLLRRFTALGSPLPLVNPTRPV